MWALFLSLDNFRVPSKSGLPIKRAVPHTVEDTDMLEDHCDSKQCSVYWEVSSLHSLVEQHVAWRDLRQLANNDTQPNLLSGTLMCWRFIRILKYSTVVQIRVRAIVVLGRAMHGLTETVPQEFKMPSNTFPNVTDGSSIQQIANPSEQPNGGIGMSNANTPIPSQQIHPVGDYGRQGSSPIELFPKDAAHVQDNAVYSGVQDIDQVIGSVAPHAASQPNDAGAVENAHLDLGSTPLVALLPDNNMPTHFGSAYPFPITDAALRNPQLLPIDSNAQNPLPFTLNHTAAYPTFPDYSAPRFTEQLAPAIAPMTSGFPFPAVTPPSLPFENTAHYPLPLTFNSTAENPAFPVYSASPSTEQPAREFAAVPPELLFPAVTSPITTPASRHAQPTLGHATLPQSPATANVGRLASIRIGEAGHIGETKSPSRYCHVCVRLASLFGYVACANISAGTCRKVVCKRCFEKLNWDWHAAKNDPSWACCHCAGICPERASCSTYGKSNKKRKTRRSSEAQSKRIRKT